MSKHNGMRPQDIVVLSKIVLLADSEWRISDLAYSLKISASEISEVLNRCRIARLIDETKRKVHLNSFKEFIIYGIKYVFPVEPGATVIGIPTAHSAPPVSELISSGDIYVWPYLYGNSRGQAIQPLYKSVPEIILKNNLLYELLAIIDTIRVGRVREVKIAIEELEKRIKND
jgi:hypothetical protein